MSLLYTTPDTPIKKFQSGDIFSTPSSAPSFNFKKDGKAKQYAKNDMTVLEIKEAQRKLGVKVDGDWGPITEKAYQLAKSKGNIINTKSTGRVVNFSLPTITSSKTIAVKENQSKVPTESTGVRTNTMNKVKKISGLEQLSDEELSKLRVSPQVGEQIKHAQKYNTTGKDYTILDKKNNIMYYVNTKGKIINYEPVITGAASLDRESAQSMKEYLSENGGTSKDYYNYLRSTRQRVTPAGVYTAHPNKNDSAGKPHSMTSRVIGTLPFAPTVKLNTLDNPSLIHGIYNEMPWRKEEKEEYLKHRAETYGDTGNMIRLTSQYGVPSSKAIHGTGYVDRVAALGNNRSNKKMSNGCVNVGGKTKCFDTVKEGSQIYVLPEERNGVATITSSQRPGFLNGNGKKRLDKKISREDISLANRTKAKVTDIIKRHGIKATPKEVDFATAIMLRETKGGTSLLSSVESILPGFGSYGLYEQQKNFPYLKGGDPNDEKASTQAVIDFYRAQLKKNANQLPEQTYSAYVGGEDRNGNGIINGVEFRKNMDAVVGYRRGGILY